MICLWQVEFWHAFKINLVISKPNTQVLLPETLTAEQQTDWLYRLNTKPETEDRQTDRLMTEPDTLSASLALSGQVWLFDSADKFQALNKLLFLIWKCLIPQTCGHQKSVYTSRCDNGCKPYQTWPDGAYTIMDIILKKHDKSTLYLTASGHNIRCRTHTMLCAMKWKHLHGDIWFRHAFLPPNASAPHHHILQKQMKRYEHCKSCIWSKVTWRHQDLHLKQPCKVSLA